MKLPGGLWLDDRLNRSFAFRPLTGTVELAVAEAFHEAPSLPAAVTSALAAALDHVDHQDVAPALIDALSVGDRQFLAQQLAGCLGKDAVWLTATCTGCRVPFDFQIHFSRLPVKAASADYPFARVETSRGVARWRVPTGADQKALASVTDHQQAVSILAARCLVEVRGHDPAPPADQWVAGLSAADLARVEASLEETAPEVATAVRATCPECDQESLVAIDPYLVLRSRHDLIDQEIHTIASTYHWREADILALPRQRRRRYLHLIDRSRGMTQ